MTPRTHPGPPALPRRNCRGEGTSPRASRFSVDIRRHLGTVEITVCGEVDALGCELLAGALSDVVDGQGNLDVIVHLGAVAHIEPSALQAIAAAADTNARRGGRLRITATMNDDLIAAGLGGLVSAPRKRASTTDSTVSKNPPLPSAPNVTSQIESAPTHRVLPAQVS